MITRRSIAVVLSACLVFILCCPMFGDVTTYTVKNQTLNPVSDLLFGQMMERAGNGPTGLDGEPGPEAALIPGTHELQPEALRLLQTMNFPIIRFPGGGGVDNQDWVDLVDDIPGRASTTRPAGKAFGYDEYLRLSEKLHCQTIFPVDLRESLWKDKTPDQAALMAAGLVAYCNAPVGAKLPDGMPDWPALRAKHGHPEPYHIKYFQIGNEMFVYYSLMDKIGHIHDPEEQVQWCLTCIRKYIQVMRQVDPSIKIIVDGVSWSEDNYKVVERLLTDPYIKDHADYLAHHLYLPSNMKNVQRNGADVAIDDLSPEECWNTLVSLPFMDKDGLSVLQGSPMPGRQIPELAARYHWKIAMTEWNWNGGAGPEVARSLLMKGIAAAGILHAIIRDGSQVELATQSMLIGSGWHLAAIHVDPTGKVPAYPHPSGQMTAFYSKYHGQRNLLVEAPNLPAFAQPIQLGQIQPQAKIAVLDALATATDKKLFFHVINRDFNKDRAIAINLADFNVTGKVVQHTLEGRIENKPPDLAWITDKDLSITDHSLTATLPKRSVSILEIDLNQN